MTEIRPGTEAPVFRRSFLNRFLATLLIVLAAGAAAQFFAFRVVLTRRLPETFSAIHHALRNLSALLAPMLAFSTLAYVLLMGVAAAFLCVFAFHRVAGPVYRIESALDNLGSGEPVKAVFLREGDQLAPLGTAFNSFVARLRRDRQEWLEVLEHAERLCLRDPASCRAGKEEALGRLSAYLSRYR